VTPSTYAREQATASNSCSTGQKIASAPGLATCCNCIDHMIDVRGRRPVVPRGLRVPRGCRWEDCGHGRHRGLRVISEHRLRWFHLREPAGAPCRSTNFMIDALGSRGADNEADDLQAGGSTRRPLGESAGIYCIREDETRPVYFGRSRIRSHVLDHSSRDSPGIRGIPHRHALAIPVTICAFCSAGPTCTCAFPLRLRSSTIRRSRSRSWSGRRWSGRGRGLPLQLTGRGFTSTLLRPGSIGVLVTPGAGEPGAFGAVDVGATPALGALAPAGAEAAPPPPPLAPPARHPHHRHSHRPGQMQGSPR
jgi:hypothetical protein